MEEMCMKVGDQVALVRKANNTLLIVPVNAAPTELVEVTAIITPNDGSNLVKRKVVSMYLAGYNVIHLKSKGGRMNPAIRDTIRELTRHNLVGTEMIAEGSDIITLQVLMSLPELPVNTAIKRMYLIASSMHKDAMTALLELNHALAKEVIKSDDEVDRFSLYVLRNLVIATKDEKALQEMGLKNLSDCLSYRVVVKSIERVADHACGIAEMTLRLKETLPKETSHRMEQMSSLALKVLDDSVESLLRRDYKLADKTVDNVENIHTLEEGVVATIKDGVNDPASVRLVLEDIRRTAEYASDIAEATLNETVNEVIEKQTATKMNQH